MTTPAVTPTFLVVDDEAGIRNFVVRALKSAGWAAREAANGRSALALLGQHHFDLLLTDLVMPDGEGIELIMAVKQKHPNLPIIAISGHGVLGPGQFLEAARLLGAVRTLTKPFEASDLLAAVKEALGTTPAA